jgi:hypothetical protein
MKPTRKSMSVMLLAVAAALAGCGNSLDDRSVREFIDLADEAARKRYAPEICELRAKEFTQELSYQALHSDEPAESQVSRKLWCREAGKFAGLRQYQLERTSLDIDVAQDHKSARVVAGYKEIYPYYEAGSMYATPDSFQEFVVVESRDESTVAFEDGDLVFMNARVEARETELIPKGQFNLPYN